MSERGVPQHANVERKTSGQSQHGSVSPTVNKESSVSYKLKKKNDLSVQNDNCQSAGTTKVAVKSHGKKRLKMKAFRRPRKTDTEGAHVEVECSKYGSNREELIADGGLLCTTDSENRVQAVTAKH